MKEIIYLELCFQIISDSELKIKEDIIKFGIESWPITGICFG